MTPRTAIVTSLYGDYDDLAPPPPHFDDCVLVTDKEHSESGRGWRQVILPQPGRHPRLAAKLAKCRPDLFTDCEASLWVDASTRFTRPEQSRSFVDMGLERGDFVLRDHPEDRDCAVAEAEWCHGWPKYSQWPVLSQAQAYIDEGLPSNFGLWACGVMARRHTPEVRDFGTAWFTENEKWSIQDQVSFPYICWKMSMPLALWSADEFAAHIAFAPHHSND